ncbi:MAG: hypothetical protein NC548_30700 [Lachnospiraceae bacterium]|nr:hypothetical protein [Lachnospiraceae bacterium]
MREDKNGTFTIITNGAEHTVRVSAQRAKRLMDEFMHAVTSNTGFDITEFIKPENPTQETLGAILDDEDTDQADRIIKWASRLSLDQAIEVARKYSGIFNNIVSGDVSALRASGDDTLIRVINSIPHPAFNAPRAQYSFDFLNTFIAEYLPIPKEKLAAGYQLVWEYADALQYSKLLELGESMLNAALESCNV